MSKIQSLKFRQSSRNNHIVRAVRDPRSNSGWLFYHQDISDILKFANPSASFSNLKADHKLRLEGDKPLYLITIEAALSLTKSSKRAEATKLHKFFTQVSTVLEEKNNLRKAYEEKYGKLSKIKKPNQSPLLKNEAPQVQPLVAQPQMVVEKTTADADPLKLESGLEEAAPSSAEPITIPKNISLETAVSLISQILLNVFSTLVEDVSGLKVDVGGIKVDLGSVKETQKIQARDIRDARARASHKKMPSSIEADREREESQVKLPLSLGI